MASGKEIAKDNVNKFEAWIAERREAKDWQDYCNRSATKLSRKDIAAECDFAVSVLRQNPAVKGLLMDLEAELVLSGVMKSDERTAEEKHIEQRMLLSSSKDKERIKNLEEVVATQRAEIEELKRKLQRYGAMAEHLSRTGRLPH